MRRLIPRHPGPMVLTAGVVVVLALGKGAGAAETSADPAASTEATSSPATQTGAAQPRDGDLEEIIVRGTRLWQLRQAMIEAEERFYARYNELNQDDDFDVSCAMEAPLGTRLKQRVCRVAFQVRAEADHAQALVTGGHAASAQVVILERQQEYRRNALAVIQGDRRLQALARDRERLQKNYEAERARRFKGRWILFE